jgi:hypothetical protein
MYCRFYLLVNLSILHLFSGLFQQPSPPALLRLLPPLRPSTSKWGSFTFVCLVAQSCQSCDTTYHRNLLEHPYAYEDGSPNPYIWEPVFPLAIGK